MEDIVVIEVDKFDPRGVEHRAEAGLFEDEVGVATVALSLGREDLARSPSPEYLGGGADHFGVRVDLRGVYARLNQVRLEQNRFPRHPTPVEAKSEKAILNDSFEWGVVRSRLRDENLGSLTAFLVVAPCPRGDRRGDYRAGSLDKYAASKIRLIGHRDDLHRRVLSHGERARGKLGLSRVIGTRA